jgi:polyphosphate kinase
VALDRFVASRPTAPSASSALEDIIGLFIAKLYPGYEVRGSGTFRIIRDSDIEVEEEAEDLVRLFESALKRRRRGQVIRIEFDHEMPQSLREFVAHELCRQRASACSRACWRSTRCRKSSHRPRRSEVRALQWRVFPSASASTMPAIVSPRSARRTWWSTIPMNPSTSVVQFLRQAARGSRRSRGQADAVPHLQGQPDHRALIDAAEAGKSVTALVELKARFDEEANIRWARDLERAGVQVVFGFFELKTHAKMSLVVRREDGKLRNYVHLGTGNYHPVTARFTPTCPSSPAIR